MSEHSQIVIGLKEREISGDKKDLYFIEYGREYGPAWTFKIEPSNGGIYRRTEDKQLEKENANGIIYGIPIAGTWNGIIELDKILVLIEEAKQLFKKLTGQEGKTYFVGEQM